MQNKIKVWVLIACAGILSLSYALAAETPKGMCHAQSGCMMMGQMRGQAGMEKGVGLEDMFYHKSHFILMNADELKLSEEQMQKVEDLKYKIKRSMTLSKAEIDVLALDIMQALSETKVDMPSVNNLIDKKYEAKKAQAKELAQAYADLRMTLTRDQEKMMKDMMGKKMMMGMHSMMKGEDKMGCGMMKDKDKEQKEHAE